MSDKIKPKVFTIQEIWSASKSNIHKNCKKYNRKIKHKSKTDGE